MRRYLISVLLVVLGVGALLTAISLADSPSGAADGTGHAQYEALQGPFETGPEVTAACLDCHTDAASEIHETTHWTWTFDDDGEEVGKREVVNNYCVSVVSNEPRCTSCHIGYGWRDDTFDFTAETSVDCLVCHDTTGTYQKFPTGAGHPVYETTEFKGRTWEPPDLVLIAQNVGPTSRETCGTCHFSGGGGDAVKHGDLDPTLVDPSHSLDVHMDAEGLDFTCSTCHAGENHQIQGSRYGMTVVDETGIDVPGHTDGSRSTCESCHGNEPHEGEPGERDYDSRRLNDHTEMIACQTCHIPEYAREMATKMWWDWSQAGQMGEDGSPMVIRDPDTGLPTYNTLKGEFEWESNVIPEYVWFNGETDFNTIGDPINPDEIVTINELGGGPDDEGSRIWPMKRFRAIQPYDVVNEVLLVPHLFPYGPDDAVAYWRSFDWSLAVEEGMRAAGESFSGEYDFIETEMYWPITHMVAPAEDALECESCHTDSGGRMENVPGVSLDPVRSR